MSPCNACSPLRLLLLASALSAALPAAALSSPPNLLFRVSADHGFVVVHGHTIVDEPEVRDNRIGIDTGAYMSGRLTAVALEGTERWLVQVGPEG